MFAFLRRTPLRLKLVASVLTLMAAALLVIGVSVTYVMDRYFNNQVNIQISSMSGQIVNQLEHEPTVTGFLPGELGTSASGRPAASGIRISRPSDRTYGPRLTCRRSRPRWPRSA